MGLEGCPNHPGAAIAKRCAKCQGDFCAECVVATDLGARCPRCIEPPGTAAPASGGSGKVVAIVIALSLLGVCGFGAIVAAIAIPNLVSAKKHGNEAAAIGALKTINTSQSIFREGDKEQDDNLDYGMLSELSDARLVDSVLGSGTKQGYLFEAAYSPTTSEFLWWGMACPVIPGTTGERVFYTNQAGVIWYVPAGPQAPPKPNPKTCEPPAGARPVGR